MNGTEIELVDTSEIDIRSENFVPINRNYMDLLLQQNNYDNQLIWNEAKISRQLTHRELYTKETYEFSPVSRSNRPKSQEELKEELFTNFGVNIDLIEASYHELPKDSAEKVLEKEEEVLPAATYSIFRPMKFGEYG